MGGRLFISHASEDDAVVSRIVTYLEARGVPCWIASRDIPPRAIYADEITAAMQASAACAVIVSRAANQSKAIKRELELASHYDKPFIPIRVDDSEPAPGVDYYLRNTQWMNYKRDAERALDRIVAHMADGAPSAPAPAARPPAAPPPPARPINPMLVVGALSALVLVIVAVVFGPSLTGGSTQVSQTPIDDAPIEEVVDLPVSPVAPAVDSAAEERIRRQQAETERMVRERDEAVAAAESARQQLAAERAQSSVAAPPSSGWTTATLSGTTWWGTTTLSGLANIGWRLQPGGVATWGSTRGDYGVGADYYRWTLQGSTLTIRGAAGQSLWTGTLNGDSFTGTVTDTSPEFTFSLRRE